MVPPRHLLLFLAPAVFLAAACSTLPEASPVAVYGPGGGGSVIGGVVTDMKPAVFQGPGSGLGGFLGGSAGMIGGSQIGGGAGAQAAGAFGGLIVGAIAGQAAEKQFARKKAWELWIEGDDGKQYLMPVLEPHPFFLDGRVRIVLGDFGQPVSVHPVALAGQ